MPNTNTTLNTAAPATYLNKTFYDRLLLKRAKTKLVHGKYGQERSIPDHNGTTVEYRRFEEFDPLLVTPGLTEGITPEGQKLSQTHVEAKIKQYGAYVEVSDLLKRTSYDEVVQEAAELLGDQLGTAIEWVTRDIMNTGTNVQYANGKTSRATLSAEDKLTTVEVRKAVRTLKKNKAPMFDNIEGKKKRPHYICITSPDATFDLQDDPLWQDVSKYSNAEAIYDGEIGRLFGVVFVESTEAKVFESTDEETLQTDVHSALVFGTDAYGTVKLEGKQNIETIIKPLGSEGSGDPLNQRATVGAKVEGYTSVILNNAWIVRIEHGATA